MNATPSNEVVISRTLAGLEKDVIGLNLCPFAQEVHVSIRIRYKVSQAGTPHLLRADLMDELLLLHSLDPVRTDTTLLIHPRVRGDVLEYNDFLDFADDAVRDLGLKGSIQIASIHPRDQFAGTELDDVTNRTNRSPYPILHLLRRASVERALSEYPDGAQIRMRNVETLRRLGARGEDGP